MDTRSGPGWSTAADAPDGVWTVERLDEELSIGLAGWWVDVIEPVSGPRVHYGVCPRCRAMVWYDGDAPASGPDDGLKAHEAWHAATDHPVPAELVRERERLLASRTGGAR
ncbi:hypothetical protein GCM10023088_78250 [Actinomadura verrucosospora]|uniref:hypothetical protein n=1 Tax=Actinomadura verrucosospora TaxID=46165 RepID=UPI0031F16B5D